MAEEWDLFAVVRSCRSANNTATPAMDSAAADPLNSSVARAIEDDPLSCLASLKFEDENDDRFSFPNLSESRTNAFQELQQFYKPFFSNPTTTTTTTSTCSRGIVSDSSISEFGGRGSGQHREQYHVQLQQHHHHDNLVPTNTTINRPRFSPGSYISGFGGFREEQDVAKHAQQPQQEQKNKAYQRQEEARDSQQGLQSPAETSSAATSLPIVQSQTPRSRKRKSQQKRMVCHVTAENLSGDLWAWRKYGQKPIKGSPYPRNYYRCSSSKGCAARKQVERSNSDPNMFIVTYTGDHTHPRPTHRNSLAGSSRSKFTTTQKPTTDKDPNNSDIQPPTISNPSCSSPLSATSLSPTTPMTVQTHDDDASTTAKQQEDQNLLSGGDDKESEEMETYENEHEDDDILIPNMSISEDIFLGLQEIGCGSPVAGAAVDHQSPSSSENSDKVRTSLASYWASSSSAVGGGF